jgi:hypothetical protein
MQMYPGWSARDNYAQSKKKKRKRESETSKKSIDLEKRMTDHESIET